MAAAGRPAFVVVASGTTGIALSANATKTVLAVVAGTNTIPTITEIGAGFDGTSTLTPVTVELVAGDNTAAGTSTSFTPPQVRGEPISSQCTAQHNYTAEPTNLQVLRRYPVSNNGGLLVIQNPLGREPHGRTGSTFRKLIGLRCVTAAGVSPNFYGHIEWEE